MIFNMVGGGSGGGSSTIIQVKVSGSPTIYIDTHGDVQQTPTSMESTLLLPLGSLCVCVGAIEPSPIPVSGVSLVYQATGRSPFRVYQVTA